MVKLDRRVLMDVMRELVAGVGDSDVCAHFNMEASVLKDIKASLFSGCNYDDNN